MHITITTKTTNSSTVTETATAIGCLNIPPISKRPETESDKSPRIQPVKMNHFSNGVLKRHKPHNHHHVIVAAAAAAAASVFYKECLKNHAATIGRHSVDGCGEFMPSLTATVTDPTSIKCEACGCHRNFHRCESNGVLGGAAPLVVEYSPQHRHYPLQAVEARRKRFRTKFSKEQKEKMMEFAEKVGWKIQKCKEELVSGFCKEIGVERRVFKVWMHNNKNTFIVKRSGNTNYENSSSNNNSHTNASSSSS